MNFWANISRYPRFFISSIVGLFLILITPILKIVKNISNKKVLILFFIFIIGILLLILDLMLTLDYY